jgi:peptide/nickel transport system permease protein
MVVLLALVLASAFAGLLTDHDPTEINLGRALRPPDAINPLGTDHLGRDELSRILYGGRVSLSIGFASALGAVIVGVLLGLGSGYFGKRVEIPILASSDLLLAFPSLLFAIFLVATIGAGIQTLIVAIAVREIPVYVRLVRSYVLSLKEMDFVTAARAIGARDGRILFSHVLPNTVAIIIVQSSFMVARAIITAASLGFLGLGVPSPTPEWGVMLAEARPYLTLAPHLMILPGVMLALIVLSLNLVGDALRDFLDPRMRNTGNTA